MDLIGFASPRKMASHGIAWSRYIDRVTEECFFCGGSFVKLSQVGGMYTILKNLFWFVISHHYIPTIHCKRDIPNRSPGSLGSVLSPLS